jgi:hypothetical protein
MTTLVSDWHSAKHPRDAKWKYNGVRRIIAPFEIGRLVPAMDPVSSLSDTEKYPSQFAPPKTKSNFAYNSRNRSLACHVTWSSASIGSTTTRSSQTLAKFDAPLMDHTTSIRAQATESATPISVKALTSELSREGSLLTEKLGNHLWRYTLESNKYLGVSTEYIG